MSSVELELPSASLDVYRGDLLARASSFTRLHDDELRRRAVRAARDRDAEALWEITLAHLVHAGEAGVFCSAHTLRAYAVSVRQFVRHATENSWSVLRPNRHQPQVWVNTMLSHGRAVATVRVRVAGAAALYRALRWTGATDVDPFRDVRFPRSRTPGVEKNRPYTEGEVRDLLEAADEHDRLLLLLLAHGGLRIAEALALEWEDLDIVERRVQVRRGKGGRSRTVAMSSSLARAVRAYRGVYARMGTAGRVFGCGTYNGAKHHFTSLYERAGVRWRGFHALRKYAGTRLNRQVRDFARVAAHLGHADINTTRVYVELPADDLKEELASW